MVWCFSLAFVRFPPKTVYEDGGVRGQGDRVSSSPPEGMTQSQSQGLSQRIDCHLNQPSKEYENTFERFTNRIYDGQL